MFDREKSILLSYAFDFVMEPLFLLVSPTFLIISKNKSNKYGAEISSKTQGGARKMSKCLSKVLYGNIGPMSAFNYYFFPLMTNFELP